MKKLSLLFFLAAFGAFGQSYSIRTVDSLSILGTRRPERSGEVVLLRSISTNRPFAAPRPVRHSKTSTATVDNGCIFATWDGNGRWEADDCREGKIDVSWFDAVGDGVTDDTAALQSAAAAVPVGGRLLSPAGKTYLTTNSITLTNSQARVDFSGSTIKFTGTTRKSALRAGPTEFVISGMNFAISTSTNYVTGVPSSTFAAGDMVLLYNNVQSPANYNPGQLAFVTAASGTTMTLDRFPDTALQVTNAYRFVSAPEGIEIRNVVVDLSGATDGIGISAVGLGHVVVGCRVVGTGTTNDPNYIGIELRGKSITARDNYVSGILDAGNAVDRSGYGIFLAGDNILAENNDISDCKHCISSSERKAISRELRVLNNRIRQRFDWAHLTDVNGAYLFLGALDIHANVRHAEIRGNDIRIGGRYALSLRNGNFDVLYNTLEVVEQPGLPFSQHGNAISEAFLTRANFVGNLFKTPTNSIHFYFDRADSGVSGTHSNLTLRGNQFEDGLLTFNDEATGITNGFVNLVLSGNAFNRSVGTAVAFIAPITNAMLVGNQFNYAGGNGASFQLPWTDADTPAREIYVAGNSFHRLGGTGHDLAITAGPTNIIELGNNRFSDSPFSGFPGRVAVSRTPPNSVRYQLIDADEDEIWWNSTTGSGNPARLRWGGSGAMMGYETEFFSYRLLASDRAFSSGLPDHAQRDFVIKADGLMSWSDGTNAANIVLGPRRIQDLTNGVLRLSGGFGLTERTEPIQPSSTTATIWLEEADTSKSIKVKWPDGSNTALYPQAGGTNSATPDWANVMDYGAVGDGVADDTSAFQAAFDATPSGSTNQYTARGGTVYIPSGIYRVTAPITIGPGAVLGESRFGTVIISELSTGAVFTASTATNTPSTGIWAYRFADFSIHQAIGIVPTDGAAIRVTADDGFTASMVDIENVWLEGTYRGFHGTALQGGSIKGLTLYATVDDGVLLDAYQTMFHIQSSWAYYCGQDGSGHGFHLKGPAYCTASASGADSNYGWGWYIESGTVQAPRGNSFTVGAEQNRDGGMFIKNAIGGIYSPMVVTPDDLPTAADGIVVDNGVMVGLVGAFTQQGIVGGTGYPLRVTNSVAGYPSVVVNSSYLNSYNTGSAFNQALGIATYLPWEERGFIGLNTDGKPRRMLDVHDRTGVSGTNLNQELMRLALHTSDTNGNAIITLSPDGEKNLFKLIANNPSATSTFQYGTNSDLVIVNPSTNLVHDAGSIQFVVGPSATPALTIKGGDSLGSVGVGIARPNPAALLDVRSSNRGLLLPSWESSEFLSGTYGSGSSTPPGLLAYDSTGRRVRVQTRNSDDGLTNNQYTTLFGYTDYVRTPGVAHRKIGSIFPQSVNTAGTNIGSVYIEFTAEDVGAFELEQNSFRAGPYTFGTFGDTILRNNYTNASGAYGNLLLMAGDNPSVVIGNGTDRANVTVNSNLTVAGTITLGGVTRASWPSGSGGGLTNIFPSLTNMLVAGANVTLAINTTNQTIWLSSSGGGGGATNGTSVSVNGGTALSVANINNTTGIAVNVSGTNVTFSIVDRDFGDLTVSSSGTVFTIDNGVINTNKIDATFYAWINNKPDLSDINTWTDTNTFTKPITVPTVYTISLVVSNPVGTPSGGTGTNNHPAEALLVGNGSNVVKHLVASANKLAGWNGSGAVTNIGAGTGIAINDGIISATGTNAPQLGVNGSSVANPNLTNGPQISPSVTASNIVMVINPTSIDTNKVDATFHAALVKDDVGEGTNVIVNNVKIQPARFTNNPAVTGGVLFSTNANGDIVAVATNLPAGGGGSSTNYVNNLPYSPLKLTNDSVSVGGIVFTTNSNGDVKAQATNLPTVTNAPVTGLWQTLGSADVIVENTGTTTANVTFTNYSGIVTNISQIGNEGSNNRLQLSLAFNADVGTNYVVIFDFEGADDADPSYALVGWSQASARTATACEVSIVNNDGFVYSNDGYKIRIRIINPNATAGGSGGSSVTNLVQLSDVNVSTPLKGQVLGYDGTNWVNRPLSRMETSDFWIEHFTGIFGGAANEAIALDEWTATTVSGGTKALVGTYAGRNGVWMATAAPASISSGAAIYHNGAILVPTNTMHFKASVILVLTNDLMVRAAYTDVGSSTNLPTDAFELVVTNGIIIGEACQGGFANRTQTATSFQCSSNIWYNWRVFATNSVVWFNVYTNKTQLAWSDSVTSNVPNNTQLVGVGILAVSNGSSSTNKLLIGVDTIGHGYSVQ